MREKVAVFEISSSVNKVELDQIKINNINNIFTEILTNSSHSSIAAEINDDNCILDLYNTNKNVFAIEEFANTLLKVEFNSQKGVRKKNIREGFLFIRESASDLVLLKLEKTSVADTETFEMIGQLGTEKSYYKACIFQHNGTGISVIDKSNRIAHYWIKEFLGLREIRNSKVNTSDLVKFIESDELFADDLKIQENFSEVKKETKRYIFENITFEKGDLISHLNSLDLIEVDDSVSNYEAKVFSDDSSILDYTFAIDQKVLRDKYKGSIEISKETIIKTDNLEKLLNREAITFEENKVILTVSEDYIPKVRALLGVNDD